jgi:hypothetical protein
MLKRFIITTAATISVILSLTTTVTTKNNYSMVERIDSNQIIESKENKVVSKLESLDNPLINNLKTIPNLKLNFLEPANAWWERIVYRISDLNEADVIDGCRKNYGNIQDASRRGDKISCYVIRVSGNTRIGYDIRLDGSVMINNKYSGNAALSSSGSVYSNDGTKLEVTKYTMSTNESCDKKWPGYGAWAGDGGVSCYDSYQKWR